MRIRQDYVLSIPFILSGNYIQSGSGVMANKTINKDSWTQRYLFTRWIQCFEVTNNIKYILTTKILRPVVQFNEQINCAVSSGLTQVLF